jgi:hypothetical protein
MPWVVTGAERQERAGGMRSTETDIKMDPPDKPG